MFLYIRRRPSWISFVHSVSELRELCAAYVPGAKLLLGDLTNFNKQMIQVLLKFLEENPAVDCYASEEVTDRTLLSRFVRIEKENEPVMPQYSDDSFLKSPRRALDAQMYLSLPAGRKVLAIGCTSFELALLKAVDGSRN